MDESKSRVIIGNSKDGYRWITVLYIFLVAVILRYTYKTWSLVLIGVFGCLCYIMYLAVCIRVPRRRTKIAIQRKLKLLTASNWNEYVEHLHFVQAENTPIIRESFLISETIEDFIDLIIREFISRWFVNISKSTVFQDSVTNELRFVVSNLKTRLEKINFADLLVSKVTPTLTDHLNHFIKAYDAVKTKNNKLATDSFEFLMEVAQQYDGGKLHPGVTVCNEINSISDSNEKKYLRNKISSVLPYLLSDNEKTNSISTSLIKEILSCTILYSVFQMMSEGDFYNLMIARFIGDNLKHKYQVNQLRAALKEYSQRLDQNENRHKLSGDTIINRKKKLTININDNMSDSDYADILHIVSTEATLDELKMLKVKLLNRLKEYRKKNNSELNGGKLAKLKTCLLKVNEQISKMGSSASIIADRKSKDYSNRVDVTRVLGDKSAFSIFFEFMDDKGKKMLRLWQMIEQIKAPLEDSTIDIDGESKLNLSSEFSSVDDINSIYSTFFNDKDIEVLREDFKAVQDFINCKNMERVDLYRNARKHLFKLQNQIFDRILQYYPAFKKSSFFSRVLDLSSIKMDLEYSSATSSDNENQDDRINERLDSKTIKGIDNANFLLKKKLSKNVVKAVEDAFTEIMKSEQSGNIDSMSNKDSVGSENLNLKSDLLGDSSSLFEENNFRYPSKNKSSNLFDDTNGEYDSDSDSLEFDSDNQMLGSLELENNDNSDLQLFLAAPGNLSLSEEISKLTDEIEKLDEQMILLEPLIRKAELTNNISELKILRKSRTSLEREIMSKELQKQQYIVQENDNSLYGKSTVRIQSYISGQENGKDFILYIVEVQKFSSENPNIITAGWIVARRYSQFFKLHEYLKSRYLVVSGLKFPNRIVSVLKFNQQQLVELRKAKLEEYIRQLLGIPEVCSNRVFRSFLSSENFNIRKNQLFEEKQDKKLKKGLKIATALYGGISNHIIANQSLQSTNPAAMDNLKDIERELRQFDEGANNEIKKVFVKPICDFLAAVFKLNSSNSWLRARALLVILQQIFGSTIERKVYELVHYNLQSEERVLDILTLLKNIVFPNGKFKDPPIFRNLIERSTTKNDANILLGVFMNETFSKIFGSSNTRYAHFIIFEMLQNDFLNKHLLFEILDIFISELFPEAESR